MDRMQIPFSALDRKQIGALELGSEYRFDEPWPKCNKFIIIEEKQPIRKGADRHGEISDQKRRHQLALAQKLESP